MSEDTKPGDFAGQKLSMRLAALLLLLAALAAYQNSFAVPFQYDDISSILENESIRSLWNPEPPSSPQMAGATVQGRPFTNFTLAVNYAIGGYSTFSYHLINLVIHFLAALTLMGLLRRTLQKAPLAERYGSGALNLSFAVALLWLLHPLQTESVTYIVQRAESLASLFYLLTLYCALRHLKEKTPSPWGALSVGAALLAVSSKEMAVSAPLLVLLYDYTFVSPTLKEALKKRWLFYLSLFATLGLLAHNMLGAGTRHGTVGFSQGITSFDYALSQLWGVCLYLKLSIWPSPLILDYGGVVVDDWWRIAVGGAVVAFLACVTVAGLMKKRPEGFAGALFFSLLAPTSSFIPVSPTYVEHRMYLALSVVLTVLVLGFDRLYSPLRAKGGAIYAYAPRLALIVTAVAFCLLTLARNLDYSSPYSLWSDTVEKAPGNARALAILAGYTVEEGRPGEAVMLLQRAKAIDPGLQKIYISLGTAYFDLREYDKAVENFKKAIELEDIYPKLHNALALTYLAKDEPALALPHFESALSMEPDNALAHFSLGGVYFRLGDGEKAAASLQRAVELRPEWSRARFDLGRVYLSLADGARSQAAFEELLRREPGFPGVGEMLEAAKNLRFK